MPPLADRNSNPGDLRFAGQVNASPGQGGFASFPTPQDGQAALLNDIQAKINRSPNATLVDFSKEYAPEDDGNNPAQYAANIANQVGVSPDATIGSLEPEIGKFADAIAKNEGYQPQQSGVSGAVGSDTASQAGQTAGQAYKAVGGAPGVAAGGGLLAAGGLLGGVEGLGAEALGGLEGLGSDAVSAVGGAVGKLFGGGQQQQQAPQQDAPAPETNFMAPSANEQAAETPQAKPTGVYNSLSSMLSTMVGGQQLMQEGDKRGIDPIQVLEDSGAASVLQPDENGNLDKIGATNLLNNHISQDKEYQQGLVQSMHSPVDLNEAQARAESEINEAMADSGEKQKALKEVGRIFDDYRAEQPDTKDERGNTRLDEQGNPVKSNYILPARYQKKKELLSVSERDFAKPQHERAAATHVKEAMRKHLSEIAKREGVAGWDETNRRMEALILAKKAVKKLPKKAQRDKVKEFRKDLMASLAGGAVGHLLGHGIAGTVAGHLIERQLGDKEYKKIGSKKEREHAHHKSKQHPRESLAGIKLRQKKSKDHDDK